jgi:hypothetical protein
MSLRGVASTMAAGAAGVAVAATPASLAGGSRAGPLKSALADDVACATCGATAGLEAVADDVLGVALTTGAKRGEGAELGVGAEVIAAVGAAGAVARSAVSTATAGSAVSSAVPPSRDTLCSATSWSDGSGTTDVTLARL